MIEILLLATLLQQATAPTAFNVRAELQGLYDEISQATLQFVTESDVDLFHDVLYTPDWVFIDATGQKQTWSQVREREVQALSAPPLKSMDQPIQKVSVTPEGATVIVNTTTVRGVVDAEGRYGRPGAAHTLTETTTFQDQWLRAPDSWKLKSRKQIGKPIVSVDKREPST